MSYRRLVPITGMEVLLFTYGRPAIMAIYAGKATVNVSEADVCEANRVQDADGDWWLTPGWYEYSNESDELRRVTGRIERWLHV